MSGRVGGRLSLAAGWAVVLMVVAACGDSAPTPPVVPPIDSMPPIDSVPVLTALPGTLSGFRLDEAVTYTPAYPLWSNGLTKDRAVLLPTGTVVDNAPNGLWSFPEGTILLKTFRIEGPDGSVRPVETRVLWRTGGEWETGIYLWDEAGQEATLRTVPTRVPVRVTNRAGYAFDHVVPGKSDCVKCHGAAPGFVLGFDELQLNHVAGGQNQLVVLASAGVLARTPPASPEAIEGADAESIWVQGYLEGNCVTCHNGQAEFSLEHQVFETHVVGGTSPTGGRLIVPGDAAASQVWSLLRDGVMPNVGVQVPDSSAISRLRAWIDGLEG